MSALEKRYRRNFVIAVVMHITVIGGFIFFEQFIANGGRPAMASVTLCTPPDILGDMPKGSGTGRGAYKAPEPTGSDNVPAPSQFSATPEEGPVPTPSKVSMPKVDQNEVAIPKKAQPKKPVTPVKSTTAPPPATTAKKSTATTAAAATKSKSTTAGKAERAEDIKNRFAKALGSSPGGTSRGDGKAAGGGAGNGPIGSATGVKGGVVGGSGPGSPNWRYYEHVHDAMYAAWEQPSSALDKNLRTTIELRIARDGSITDASVRVGSGNKLMDESVLSAARKVLRLDPPPVDLVRGEFANISVNFQVEG